MLRKLSVLFATCLLCAVSMAQQGNFLKKPSPFAGSTMLSLATFDEVQKELKTTPDENKKIDELIEKCFGDMGGLFQDSGGDFDKIQTGLGKLYADYDGQILKALPAEKGTRLKQLFVQFRGSLSVYNADVAKDAGITDDQKAQLKKLNDDNGHKTMDLFGQGLQGEEFAKAMKKNTDDFKVTVAKVLTDDQNKKLKELEGAKFEFKKDGA